MLIWAIPVQCSFRILEGIDELCPRMWGPIQKANEWLCAAEQNTHHTMRFFTKTEGTHRIKRQNVALPSTPSTSPIGLCALIYTLNIERRWWFLKHKGQDLRPSEFLCSENSLMGKGCLRSPGEKGPSQMSLWSPQPKGVPTSSCFASWVDSHNQTLLWFCSHLPKSFPFFSTLPFPFFFPWHNLATSGFSGAVFFLKVTLRTFCSLLWMLLGCVDKQIISHLRQGLR